MSRTVRVAAGVILTALVLHPAPLGADVVVPYLTGRVVDEAHILSEDARNRIAAMSKAHEAATTNQVAVLTVASLGDASVEEYAVKVFEAWKLGQKDAKNGVLVVVAPKDRKMRIEVGHGLEGTLPDGAAGEIARTWMTPAFKAGNYDKGIEDGVAAIIGRLEGRGSPIDRTPAVAPAEAPGDGRPMSMQVRIFGSVFIIFVLGIFTVIGVLTPGVGWVVYFFLIPFWLVFPAAFMGWGIGKILFFGYLIGFPIVKRALPRTAWYKNAAAGLGNTAGGFVNTLASSSSGSGWSSSSSSSSWSSSSSDSFSGGGGTSGGGGASASW